MKTEKKLKKSMQVQTISDLHNSVKSIYFVGIGGVSMSSLAIFANEHGFKVGGSDTTCSATTKHLQTLGISVNYNQNGIDSSGHLKKQHTPECESFNQNEIGANGYNLVVYSSACEQSLEVQFAKNNKIPLLSRAQFLALVLNEYSTSICVSGAHGKTTTTALTYEILNQANMLPSLHLGGNLASINKGYTYSNGNTIVCEACEYKNSFLELSPQIGVILNIAPEHLDFFKTFENIHKSFQKFANKCQNLIVFNNCSIQHKNKVTFGFDNADFTAKNIKITKQGKFAFDCYHNQKKYMHVKLNLIGKHNILNALASIATCHLLGVDKTIIGKALAEFKGVERRYQYLHKKHFIVHDYAHHPDEIAYCLQETRAFYKNKLLIVFQPHTYSRTKTLMSKFVKVFKNEKDVLIIPTYSAREKYCYKGSAKLLAKNIGKNATYLKDKVEINKHILSKISKGYGVIFLGAGDIFDMAKNIAKMC